MSADVAVATAAKGRHTSLAACLANGMEQALGAVLGVLLAVLLAVVILAVALRYVLGTAILGTEELAIWLFTALVFLGMPLVSASAVALRLDALTDRLGVRGRAVAGAIGDGVVIHAAIVFLSGGSDVIALMGGTSTTLGLPEWIRFAAVPIGATLTLVLLLLRGATDGRLPSALAALAIGGGLYAAGHAGLFVRLDVPSLFAGAVALAWVLAGAPLPHALISALALAIPFGALLPEAAIVQTTGSGIGKFLLLAIPFFLLAGVLMHLGGLAERLIALAASLVGHRRGGIAQTTLLTNVMFSGVSGSSIADAAFGAKVLVPGLRAAGYGHERAAAIVAATSVLPNIIPPSIAFLILANAASLSVGALFTGGLVAGLVLAAVLAVTLHALGGVERGVRPPSTRRERLSAARAALPVLGLVLVILLGIRFGIVTPTEAAAVAALYALVLGVVLRGTAGFADAFVRSARDTAAVGLLIGTAAPFVFLLAVDRLPTAVAALFADLGGGPFLFLLVANLILLVAGCFLDIGAAILLFAPLLLPAAVAVGIDPVAFGVLLVVNLMIGGLTPPVGVLVYVVGGLTGLRAAAVFRACLPLTVALIAALAFLSAVVGAFAH
jgi:tripartite ATP-independent transporter DctM subunit